MVKKTYEAPSVHEACTRLRAGLLQGSNAFSGGNTQNISGGGSGSGNAPVGEDGTISDAKKRSVSNLD